MGKPDIPGVSTAEMQRIMDEIPREIIVPAFNELSDEAAAALEERYTKQETDEKINQKIVDIGTGDMAKAVYDPSDSGIDITVQNYFCNKQGTVYALVGSGAVGRCKIPAAWSDGDSFTVNGEEVPAYCGADAVDGDCIVEGRWVLFTFDGERLDFNGGGGLSSSKLAQATATPDDVPTGLTFYTAGSKEMQTGKLPVRGDWSATITPGGQVTVPPGRHSGNGKVTASHDHIGTAYFKFPSVSTGLNNYTMRVDTGHKILGMATGRVIDHRSYIWSEETSSTVSYNNFLVDVSYSGGVITARVTLANVSTTLAGGFTLAYMY